MITSQTSSELTYVVALAKPQNYRRATQSLVRTKPHVVALAKPRRMHSRANLPIAKRVAPLVTSAYVSTRQHTSAYVHIRQHTSAYLPLAKRVARLVEEEEGKVVHLRARMHEALG
jgi:hypothetical protein